MLSKLVTGGTTSIVSSSGATAPIQGGRYYGFRLSTGAFTLTMHDAQGTAAATAGNEIDRATHVATQPTYNGALPESEGQGVKFYNGLQSVLTAGGTATVFYG